MEPLRWKSVTDEFTHWIMTPGMDAGELGETDKLLQAAQLLRLSEAGFARDQHDAIAEQADPFGEKLDWYSLGLLDALRVSRGRDFGRLRLLTYLILLSRCSVAAVRSTEHLLTRLHQAEPGRYIEAGRRTILDMLAGKRTEPGRYVELLAADVMSTPHRV